MQPIISTMRALLIVAAPATMFAATAYGQINDSVRGAAGEDNHFNATPNRWNHPMTPWGDPDLRATLDMMQASRIPLERCADSYRPGRPACDMNQKWISEADFNENMEAYNNQIDRMAQLIAEGDVGGAMRAAGPNRIPQRQTSLLVSPANGLLPPLTPYAKQLAYEYGSDWALPGENIVFESRDDFDSWDRCITRGMPSMMMPYRYNGGFRIHQSPAGPVVLETEMIHEARVVHMDGRPAPDPAIKAWLGYSRGHWEGTTLVVETTNFPNGIEINNPLMNLAVQGSPPGNRFAHSDQIKITERIVRLNDDVWLYEITTEDPLVLTAPFTVRYPMRNDPEYFWPEYACHEDNTIVRNYVETDRYARANPTPEPEQAPLEVAASVADALAGRWVGRPRIVSIDLDIELEFIKNNDGTINGYLIGTTLGEINKPLRNFRVEDGQVSFTFPNIDPWNGYGELSVENETISGGIFGIQGTMPVTFRKTLDGN